MEQQTDLVDVLLDINKPGFDQPLPIILGDPHGLAEYIACLDEAIAPFKQIWGPLDGLVVTKDADGGVRDFYPSSRSEVVTCLLKQSLVVLYRAFDVSGMDKIKRLRVAPVELEIVDFETAVWRYPFWDLVSLRPMINILCSVHTTVIEWD
jgi:hypothetical protein